jgi:tetratricopeptide (TPR) repeat protein
MLKAFLTISVFLLLVSCKTDPPVNNEFKALEELVTNDGSEENIANLFKAYADFVKENKADTTMVAPVLERAYIKADELNRSNIGIGFMMSSIRYEKDSEKVQQKILDLAAKMAKLNKNNASMALYYGFMEAFPQHPKVAEIKANLPIEFNNLDTYINDLGQKIFVNPDKSGINRNSALRFVDACEAYALVLPDSPKAPQNLYKASEISQTLRTTVKTLSIFDWMIDRYPTFEKSSNALFLKAYLLDEEFDKKEEARVFYIHFLEQYPDHQLASSAKFLLENIGKSDAEIYDMITKKKDQ